MDSSGDERNRGKRMWKYCTAILAVIVILLLVLLLNSWGSRKEESSKEYGIFTSKPRIDEKLIGREAGSLENVAIVLTVNRTEDMERWLIGIRKQRKSSNDLPVYLVFRDNTSALYNNFLNTKKLFENVKFIVEDDATEPLSQILKSKTIDYVIEANDSQYFGADIADYYYLGREVMKKDPKIQCVCGGTENFDASFLQPSQGDVFWLLETGHSTGLGLMLHRDLAKEKKSDNNIFLCLRPEVPRVALVKDQVTKMSFSLAKMDPNLLTTEQIEKRMGFDLKNAKNMHTLDWDDLKRQDDQIVYKFPWTESEDLNHYFRAEVGFQNILETKFYNRKIGMFVDGRCVYIVNEEKHEEENK